LSTESPTSSHKFMTRFGAVEADPRRTPKPSTTSSNTISQSIRTTHYTFGQLTLFFLRAIYDREPTVQAAAALFQELCYANKDHLSAGLIIAGHDTQNGAEVYHIPSGGSLHKQEFSIGGSGSTYIYGFCDSTFQQDMTREEAIDFVKNGNRTSLNLGTNDYVALALAISRDGSSGGVIRMMILTGDHEPERLFFAEPNIPRFWEKS
jgi:hypothetical protein